MIEKEEQLTFLTAGAELIMFDGSQPCDGLQTRARSSVEPCPGGTLGLYCWRVPKRCSRGGNVLARVLAMVPVAAVTKSARTGSVHPRAAC